MTSKKFAPNQKRDISLFQQILVVSVLSVLFTLLVSSFLFFLDIGIYGHSKIEDGIEVSAYAEDFPQYILYNWMNVFLGFLFLLLIFFIPYSPPLKRIVGSPFNFIVDRFKNEKKLKEILAAVIVTVFITFLIIFPLFNYGIGADVINAGERFDIKDGSKYSLVNFEEYLSYYVWRFLFLFGLVYFLALVFYSKEVRSFFLSPVRKLTGNIELKKIKGNGPISLTPHYEIIGRLEGEKKASASRAIINLFVGIAFAIVGIVLLAIFVESIDFETKGFELERDTLSFIMRLSISLFIILFSYFFLQLYRNGLQDIKYFQNEMTNIQSKQIALETALKAKNPIPLEKVILAYASTERNFILKKDEKMIGAQQSEIDQNFLLKLAEVMKQK